MNNFNDEKDEILVELALLGNETAYEELVTRHSRSVKGTAFKVTKNEYSAEDASQDAFVSAWMNLDSLHERERFGAWVCSIAKNHAKNIVIRYKRMAADISYDSLENLNLAGDDEGGLLESIVADSTADELHTAVDALSEKFRQAITLHYFEGLSVREIAVKLSLPEGTVKWRLSEGRKQLRTLLVHRTSKTIDKIKETSNMNYKFVKATLSDIQTVSQWYKSPSVHEWICVEDWKKYYESLKNAPDYFFYSVYLDGVMVAHSAAELTDDWLAMDIIVDPSKHGQGIGTAVLREMISHSTELFGKIPGYIAYITLANIASKRCFENAGFRYQKDDDDGALVYTCQVG